MSEKCKVEYTSRTGIENKLLVALEEKGKVAILLTEEDLHDLIRWLSNDMGCDGPEDLEKCKSWVAGLRQLGKGAFGK